MSCWVVPSIAAEIWGVSLQQINERMKAGTIPTKTESGFTFVDVAPDSPAIESQPANKPPTYTVVTQEELVALAAEEPIDEETLSMGDWRSARSNAQKLRRAPIAA